MTSISKQHKQERRKIDMHTQTDALQKTEPKAETPQRSRLLSCVNPIKLLLRWRDLHDGAAAGSAWGMGA